jgi:hypothetical protein
LPDRFFHPILDTDFGQFSIFQFVCPETLNVESFGVGLKIFMAVTHLAEKPPAGQSRGRQVSRYQRLVLAIA